MKKLEREQLKNLKGGGFSGGGGGLSCEEECVIAEGQPSGCPAGKSCYNVTCPEDETQCTNRCN